MAFIAFNKAFELRKNSIRSEQSSLSSAEDLQRERVSFQVTRVRI